MLISFVSDISSVTANVISSEGFHLNVSVPSLSLKHFQGHLKTSLGNRNDRLWNCKY